MFLLLLEQNACYCRRCSFSPDPKELACMNSLVTNNKEDCIVSKYHCRTGKQAVGIVISDP